MVGCFGERESFFFFDLLFFKLIQTNYLYIKKHDNKTETLASKQTRHANTSNNVLLRGLNTSEELQFLCRKASTIWDFKAMHAHDESKMDL